MDEPTMPSTLSACSSYESTIYTRTSFSLHKLVPQVGLEPTRHKDMSF